MSVDANAQASTISSIRYEIKMFFLLYELSTLMLYQRISLGVAANSTFMG